MPERVPVLTQFLAKFCKQLFYVMKVNPGCQDGVLRGKERAGILFSVLFYG